MCAHPLDSNPVNDSLIIRGAREHNLKGVDLDLPRDTMIVFTGLDRNSTPLNSSHK